MKYCKGFLVGAIILFIANFFFGFMNNCTLSSVKESFYSKDSCEVKKDSVDEEVVNLNIAKYLQEKYGGDSLMVETISIPSSTYEYYVSGVKGTRKLEGTNDRVKKVSFKKGDDLYRINVIYDCVDGNIKVVENDESPINTIHPIVNDPNPIQPSEIREEEKKEKDSVKTIKFIEK